MSESGHLFGAFCLGSKKRMSFEDLCVFLAFWQFLVERLKECLEVHHIRVAGSLFCDQADKWASSILAWRVDVYALACCRGSRSTPRKRQTFDSTKGYPGEDVAAQFSFPLLQIYACCNFFL